MSKRVRTQTDFYSPAGEGLMPGEGPMPEKGPMPDKWLMPEKGLMPDKWQDAWSPKEQALFENNNKAYEKEQRRRKLAGQTPIIICMGGPYSDAWYPPVP